MTIGVRVCHIHQKMKSRIVKGAAKYVDIIDAGSTKNVDDEGFEHILIQFNTKPGKGFYKSKVRYSNAMGEHKIAAIIRRLDVYGDNPKSVHDKHVEMYCECLDGN